MISMVTRIKRTSNYYEILEVSKDCSDDDIKKAYRKVGRHPYLLSCSAGSRRNGSDSCGFFTSATTYQRFE
jgi:hypothetical protein